MEFQVVLVNERIVFWKRILNIKVIDRVPDIDSSSDKGLKPSGVKGEVGQIKRKRIILAVIDNKILSFQQYET